MDKPFKICTATPDLLFLHANLEVLFAIHQGIMANDPDTYKFNCSYDGRAISANWSCSNDSRAIKANLSCSNDGRVVSADVNYSNGVVDISAKLSYSYAGREEPTYFHEGKKITKRAPGGVSSSLLKFTFFIFLTFLSSFSLFERTPKAPNNNSTKIKDKFKNNFKIFKKKNQWQI